MASKHKKTRKDKLVHMTRPKIARRRSATKGTRFVKEETKLTIVHDGSMFANPELVRDVQRPVEVVEWIDTIF